MQKVAVSFRGIGQVVVDVPNRQGRSWVAIDPTRVGVAEDDVISVRCKVGGRWRLATTA
jgi:hypothetical protein